MGWAPGVAAGPSSPYPTPAWSEMGVKCGQLPCSGFLGETASRWGLSPARRYPCGAAACVLSLATAGAVLGLGATWTRGQH